MGTDQVATKGNARHWGNVARVAAFLALLPTAAQPQSGPTPSERNLFAALAADIPELIRMTGTPGLNLAIARRGQVLWEGAFGFADLERRIPMTPRTLTHSGSMGKTYTAIAVMQLVERGVLELDAPVNRYLRGWRIANPLGGREVTIRDLLTHRSGLAGNAAWPVLSAPRPLAEHVPAAYARERNDFYGGAASPTWTAKAGERYQYSNLGIATLGYLVETTNPERLSFSEYVQRHLIDPLGMTSTQFPPVQDSVHIRPDLWARMSRGYAAMGPLRVPTPAIYFEDHPAGTVVTTPADHIRVLLALQRGGELDGARILRAETVREMLTPQHRLGGKDDEFPTGPASSVGLVWNLERWGQPDRSFHHGGAHMWGWTNWYVAFPELDVAIAVFMNQWSLPDDTQGARYQEARAIIEFVRSWVQRERAGQARTVPARSWAWKVSYVQGLMMVEYVNAVLGIAERMSPATIEMMVRGAAPRPDRGGERLWDPEGFRAGLRDLAATDLTPTGIAAFFRSERLQVLSEELPLIYRELGGRGSLPAPN